MFCAHKMVLTIKTNWYRYNRNGKIEFLRITHYIHLNFQMNEWMKWERRTPMLVTPTAYECGSTKAQIFSEFYYFIDVLFHQGLSRIGFMGHFHHHQYVHSGGMTDEVKAVFISCNEPPQQIQHYTNESNVHAIKVPCWVENDDDYELIMWLWWMMND